ncbi:MAG: arsenosugar biosynthesis radical SAM protein ArsS [Deltaproteobacteria bacterium]|nr:arsenosugar biosynthesis radical SAM protein ArsS [Deltaproteobacteria bacterium]
MLSSHGLKLRRGQTRTLQINVGLLCNQNCRHCHLDAGPGRKENMTRETMLAVVDYARRSRFDVIDITGGAPELNSHVETLVVQMAALAPRVMFRSNLSALNSAKRDGLMQVLKDNRVVLVASLPSLNASQTESQRGKGIFNISIDTLLKLNRLGYGKEGSGLELNLVSNPSGAFMPASQDQAEARFRRILGKNWGIYFNNLFCFANVPLGRYREWLDRSGNFALYMEKLASSFNPCAVTDVMCRTLVSVSWNGYLYDCDFNLARGIYMGGEKTHVSEMEGPPEAGHVIATSDHCYACTAGSGFT